MVEKHNSHSVGAGGGGGPCHPRKELLLFPLKCPTDQDGAVKSRKATARKETNPPPLLPPPPHLAPSTLWDLFSQPVNAVSEFWVQDIGS